MTKHTVSAAATGLPLEFRTLDALDEALNLLRTSAVALRAHDFLDEDAIEAVTATMDEALDRMKIVRRAVYEVDSAECQAGIAAGFGTQDVAQPEPAKDDKFFHLAGRLAGLEAAAHMVRHADDADIDAVMEQIKQCEREMAATPATTREGALEGLRFLRNEYLDRESNPDGLDHFDKLQLSILKAAVSIFGPKPKGVDPFQSLLARYLKHWDACPNDTLGEEAELGWNEETSRLEAKLCDVVPTTKAGAIDAIRFIASRSPGQRCEVLDCQHALLMAAAKILAV